MVITHIAKLQNRIFSGVDVVVPQHVIAQQEFADVCILNLFDTDILGIRQYFKYSNTKFEELPEPYNKPDLVVFHEAYNIENIRIYKILIKKRIPYIIVPHGELSFEAQKKKWIKKKVANLLLFNHFIEHAVAIQCLSKREQDSNKFCVRKFLGTNGIYLPDVCKTSFREEGLRFVYIGRLDIYIKGIDLLIAAITKESIFLRKKNFSLCIYGPDDQGERSNIEKIVSENGVADIVHIFGAVTGTEKEKVLLDADVFIQTSRTEGMPMGVLEALSYGLPCIVTEGTNMDTDIEQANAGKGCPNSIDAIAIAIKGFVDDSVHLKQKSDNARNLIKEKYVWSKVSNTVIEQYSRMIK